MERTACTYTITHGIFKAVKKQVEDKLKGAFFFFHRPLMRQQIMPKISFEYFSSVLGPGKREVCN